MSKKIKKINLIIQFTILVLIITGVVFYFLYFNKKQPNQNNNHIIQEDLMEFKNNDANLSPEQIDKYFQRFTDSKNIILNNPEILNTNAWLNMARMKKYVKDYGGAEKIYLFIIQKDINNYIPEGNLADLYANYLHNYQKAVEHYWQAVKKADINKQAALLYYRNLADIYTFELESERSDFEQKALYALNQDYQESVDFLTMMAKYYKDIGNKEKAIKYLEQALNLDADNQAVRDEIERIKEESD